MAELKGSSMRERKRKKYPDDEDEGLEETGERTWIVIRDNGERQRVKALCFYLDNGALRFEAAGSSANIRAIAPGQWHDVFLEEDEGQDGETEARDVPF